MELKRARWAPPKMTASFSFSNVPTTTNNKTTTLSHWPLFSKTYSGRFKTHANQTLRFKVSCNAAVDDNDKPLKSSETPNLTLPKTSLDMQNVDRRNLLLRGLSGLYGAVNLTSLPSAFAAPIAAPSDISECYKATSGIDHPRDAVRGTACCPPVLSEKRVKDFVFPNDSMVRIRPPAHRASAGYVEKYKAAIQAMRDLPDDHPHSFKQQAKIHCAYCNGGYTQVESGFPEIQIQIHNSWLFFPFHRWYLYFYERILGKLINDPTFALPYWNWDNPTGMMLPAMFEDTGRSNPIFNAYRDATHLPPTIVDIDYNGRDRGASCIEQIGINLSAMYKQMITNSSDPLSFFGGKFRSGDDPITTGNTLTGSIEAGCHTAVHRWVGDPRMQNNEDMGNFYSAGYDPIFYVHHTNVDRMWQLWKDLDIKGHQDPTDPDWLDASYVFYDENEELVRVYNRDCVDTSKLKYDFERSDIPWAKSHPTPRTKGSKIARRSVGRVGKVEEVKFPLKLDRVVKVLVKRPAKNRTPEDKEKANEMLLMNGINYDGEKYVKFDVFVNDKDDEPVSTAAESEFAGSFAQLPHNQTGQMFMSSAARFGLTELLEDIEAEDDESVLVTFVPRSGTEDLTISEIKIQLIGIP